MTGRSKTKPAGRPTAEAAHPADPSTGPLQFTQVAFAGHNRASDLGNLHAVASGLRVAFGLLAAAGVSQGRLLTGLAPGADLAAVEAWSAAGLGPIHAIHPFLKESDRGGPRPMVHSETWLDGVATRAAGRNPHLSQTRWLIGAADLLVVVWTGRHARGAGGTADAVRLALEHRVPVLWVHPADPEHPRLIQPDYLDEDFGFLEFLEELRFDRAPLVVDATPQNLHAVLNELGLGAADGPDSDEADSEPSPERPVALPWRAYALFRRALGGRAAAFDAQTVPSDLAAQPGFKAMTRIRAAADAEAKRLGSIHRSHQVILLAIAILAASAGSSSALWPSLKLVMVVVELALAFFVLIVWLDAERGERHFRWGEARKLAEDLRLERAAWALGVGTAPVGHVHIGSSKARRARRLAGLPDGAFDTGRVQAWGGWAIDELVRGQIAYHRDLTTINGRISHRVHQVENISFGVLLVILLSYVGAAAAFARLGVETPHWLGGVVVMAGAIVPAIGAAGLGLEATLSLGEQARRSQILSDRLEALTTALHAAPGLERLQAVAKEAIRLQRAQEEQWLEDTGRRRLFRGG